MPSLRLVPGLNRHSPPPSLFSSQELKDEFKDLTKWWKKLLGDQVTSVKVSARLATTPCVVVAGKYGQSANMERIMRAQAFQDPNRAGMSRSQKVFEINPRHPVIRGLKEKVRAQPGARACGCWTCRV
jgi:heat shock protein 90kDa beta